MVFGERSDVQLVHFAAECDSTSPSGTHSRNARLLAVQMPDHAKTNSFTSFTASLSRPLFRFMMRQRWRISLSTWAPSFT